MDYDKYNLVYMYQGNYSHTSSTTRACRSALRRCSIQSRVCSREFVQRRRQSSTGCWKLDRVGPVSSLFVRFAVALGLGEAIVGPSEQSLPASKIFSWPPDDDPLRRWNSSFVCCRSFSRLVWLTFDWTLLLCSQRVKPWKNSPSIVSSSRLSTVKPDRSKVRSGFVWNVRSERFIQRN